jgi:glycosyltransferase involved in cell wall biosynthesis
MKKRAALITTQLKVAISTTVINTALYLEKQGYTVDIHLLEQDVSAPFNLETNNIHVLTDKRNVFKKLLLKNIVFALVQRFTGPRYDFIIGFDRDGIIRAGALSSIWKTPLFYHSLEIDTLDEYSTFKDKVLKYLERHFVRKALLSFVQDNFRADILSCVNQISLSKIRLAYNSPMGDVIPDKSNYFRVKFKVPPDKKIVLVVGSLIKAHCVDKIVFSSRTWPDEFVLILHGWFTNSDFETMIRSEVTSSERKGRIFLSTEFLDVKEKNIVYQSVDIGLVFFDSSPINIKYSAGSAGKLFDFMRMGIPVIGNDIPGMRQLIEDNGCGHVVTDYEQIGSTLQNIVQSHDELSKAAFAAYEQYRYEKCYKEVMKSIENMIGK